VAYERISMIVTPKSDEVTRIDLNGFTSGFEKQILYLSDIHIDSPWCERKLLKRHLDEAQDNDAMILIAGDLFDAMQGPNDPRRSYRELKDYLKGNDYFDRVLDDAYEFFKPYAENLVMLGYGNHEYSVVRHNGTDLVQRFVALMRKLDSPIVAGGYGGFIRISVYDAASTPRDTTWTYYNHGSGGEAPVTQGVIQTNRQAVYIRNCDAVWNGHNHKGYLVPVETMQPNNKDVIEQNIMWFLRTPGYKNEMQKPAHGFAASRNMAPTPRGCIWGKLYFDDRKINILYTPDMI